MDLLLEREDDKGMFCPFLATTPSAHMIPKMKMVRTLYCTVILVTSACAKDRDLAFLLKLQEAADAKPDEFEVFTYFGHSLGKDLSLRMEGGISREFGGSTWGMNISRRIVEGGYLVESSIWPKAADGKRLSLLPLTVTWYDPKSSPSSPWNRVIVTERKGEAVILERWSGVLWFTPEEPGKPEIQWVRRAAVAGSHGGTDSDRRTPANWNAGDFIGTATERVDTKGFPVVLTIQPDGTGLEVWKETRSKR